MTNPAATTATTAATTVPAAPISAASTTPVRSLFAAVIDSPRLLLPDCARRAGDITLETMRLAVAGPYRARRWFPPGCPCYTSTCDVIGARGVMVNSSAIAYRLFHLRLIDARLATVTSADSLGEGGISLAAQASPGYLLGGNPGEVLVQGAEGAVVQGQLCGGTECVKPGGTDCIGSGVKEIGSLGGVGTRRGKVPVV